MNDYYSQLEFFHKYDPKTCRRHRDSRVRVGPTIKEGKLTASKTARLKSPHTTISVHSMSLKPGEVNLGVSGYSEETALGRV